MFFLVLAPKRYCVFWGRVTITRWARDEIEDREGRGDAIMCFV